MSQRKKKRKGGARSHKRKTPSTSPSVTVERVHLKMVQDPSTGSKRLALSAAIFQQDWQNQIAAGAANTAYALFSQGVKMTQVEALAENVLSAASRLTENFLTQAEGRVACQMGCDHCCHQSVGVTPPEALRIHAFLKDKLSGDELEQLRQKFSERASAVAGLSSKERFSPEHACPFLQRGSCSIYLVRPLSCRGANSLDAEECRSRLRDPPVREAFLRDGKGGQILLDPPRAMQAISAGIQLALSEHFHLDMRPLDLILAMNLLLGEEENVGEQWLAGAEGFQAALGARSTHQF